MRNLHTVGDVLLTEFIGGALSMKEIDLSQTTFCGCSFSGWVSGRAHVDSRSRMRAERARKLSRV